MTLGETLKAKLETNLPGALRALVEFRGETMLELASAEHLVEVAQFLRDDPELSYEQLLFVTAVDWPSRAPRFDVVYQLRSLRRGNSLRVKVQVPAEKPEVPTLSGVWPAANWHEREAYDLLGITFIGHPDLRRILMPESWEGHPLRKDYVSFGEPVVFSDQMLTGPGTASGG
jgi:NADH-quinone oxidoreductase subunit C